MQKKKPSATGLVRYSSGLNALEALLASGKKRCPDFYGIGVEKAGTTWLHRMFDSHPEIGVPIPKELRYFRSTPRPKLKYQTEFLSRLIEDKNRIINKPNALQRVATELRLLNENDDSYLGIFAQFDEPVVGEISPQYCLLPDAEIARMTSLSPDAKAILLIRDPVARTISGSKMNLGNKNSPKWRDITIDDKIVRERALSGRQLRFSQYSKFLDRFEAAFEGRFFVGFFDDIVDNPLGLLSEICAFLEVGFNKDDFAFADKKVNVGKKTEISRQTKLQLYRELGNEYDFLETRFPERVRVWRKQYDELMDAG